MRFKGAHEGVHVEGSALSFRQTVLSPLAGPALCPREARGHPRYLGTGCHPGFSVQVQHLLTRIIKFHLLAAAPVQCHGDRSRSLRALPRGCSISPIFHTPSGCVSAVGEVVLFLSRTQAYKYVRGAQKHFRVSLEGRLSVSASEHDNELPQGTTPPPGPSGRPAGILPRCGNGVCPRGP